MAPEDGASADVHAELRLLRGVAILVDPMLSVGANQVIVATTCMTLSLLTPCTLTSYSPSTASIIFYLRLIFFA